MGRECGDWVEEVGTGRIDLERLVNMSTLADKLGVTQFIIYLVLLVLGVGISYGALTVRLNSIEEKTQKYQNFFLFSQHVFKYSFVHYPFQVVW